VIEPVSVFALTTRGLESVSAAEMAALLGLQVKAVTYRRVAARVSCPLSRLLDLRTIDDVFIDLGIWREISPRREMLSRFRDLSARLDLGQALEALVELRSIGLPEPVFSVSASFVGKRNYSSAEIKSAVAAGLSQRYGWRYADENASSLNLRLFIEHTEAQVGLRLSDHALHSRPYKQVHVSGSLKPSVAAALLSLAQVPPAGTLLDPFCGAGTIPIEAKLGVLSHDPGVVWAGDRDPKALLAAHTNASFAAVTFPLVRWDVLSLPLKAHSIDRIVTNLPWGRQVAPDAELGLFYRHIGIETARLLTPAGRAVFLTNLPELFYLPGRNLVESRRISLFGQQPTILIFN
jgi:tRNA (guanine6-N2)-methyltransferase